MALLVSAAAAVAPIWQAQDQFEEAIRLANALHDAELHRNERYHKEEQHLESVLHRLGMALDRELHYGEMSHQLDIAKREAIRDVWSQKNQLLQTLMIVNTLMLQCAAAVFCEGDPPVDTPVEAIRFLAVMLGVAVSSLIASVWLLVFVQRRAAQYDMYHLERVYICGAKHSDFNDFYRCHCDSLVRASMITLAIGASCTVGAGGISLGSGMMQSVGSAASGWIFVALATIGATVALGALLPFAVMGDDDDDTVVDYGGLAAVQGESADLKRRAKSARMSMSNQSTMPPVGPDAATTARPPPSSPPLSPAGGATTSTLAPPSVAAAAGGADGGGGVEEELLESEGSTSSEDETAAARSPAAREPLRRHA